MTNDDLLVSKRNNILGFLQVIIHNASFTYSTTTKYGSKEDIQSKNSAENDNLMCTCRLNVVGYDSNCLTNIDGPDPTESDIVLVNRSTESIQIKTAKQSKRDIKSSVNHSIYDVKWEQEFELRCCNSWDCEIVVAIQQKTIKNKIKKNRPNKNYSSHRRVHFDQNDYYNDEEISFILSDIDILNTDVISLANTNKNSIQSIPLRQGARCVGEIQLTLMFIPNHQSFQFLSIECTLKPDLPLRVLEEMLARLVLNNRDDHRNENYYDINNAIIGAIDFFLSFVKDQVGLSHLLSQSIKTVDSNDIRNISIAKAANISKTFLSSIVLNLPMSPQVTLNFIEKALSIFLKIFHPLNSSSVDDSDYSDDSIEWNQFMTFILVVGLWLIQTTVLMNNLKNDFSMSVKELDAVRFGFAQYDYELTGEIMASDLRYLLQDMGEDYSNDEIKLILEDIDGDHVNRVDFSDFIRWWCEETIQIRK
eukprot:gene12703-17035_t